MKHVPCGCDACLAETTQSHAQVLIKFVATKHADGRPWLGMFQNRSKQFVFQVYDPASGYPTTTEQVFLLAMPDKLPPGSKYSGGVLPKHMEVAPLNDGVLIVGIAFDERSTPEKFLSDLDAALVLLSEARVAA